MIDGFVARSVSEYKKPDELLLVTPTAITFDNVRRYRFREATNLASFLIQLELRQVLECHAMYGNHHLPPHLPNLKTPVANPMSHPASRISHRASQLGLDQCRHSFRASAVLQRKQC